GNIIRKNCGLSKFLMGPVKPRPSAAERKWIKPVGFDTGVKTYNSLTKQKEPLVLAQERIATWYSCGPTVYDHAHLGHACSYVRFDILSLEVSNIPPTVLARMHEEEFKRDMQALRVLPPAVYMRVTDNIPQIVAFIEHIIRNGHGYVTSQGASLYFVDNSCILGAQDKRDPRDFALWKASKPPGCSVFGSQLDIHSGGIDLAFTHHENEIAQSEAYHQCEKWGNYFLHSMPLVFCVEKMSISLKNYVTIKDFLESYTANEFRLFSLLTRYRSAIDYSDASMNEAYMQGHLLCQPIEEGILWERLSATQSSVRKAPADDFDTPKAVDAIMSLIHHGNCQLQPATKVDGPRCPAVFGAMLSYVREILGVFGVDLLDRKVRDQTFLNNVVEELVHPQRDRVPLLKACDALRNNLAPLGVHIKVRFLPIRLSAAERLKENSWLLFKHGTL
uniref:Cysteinyl-tRNA synthetase 2, mitochondrial n=1 Tax=Sinocyclocheilus grahami TaxID=75366 RepID=A0A672PIG5_SINGR